VGQPQLPADALVAAEQPAHQRQIGEQPLDIAALLGLDIEGALHAQQPGVEQRLRAVHQAIEQL
jgi:hypothetical protein